ncbi:MAG: hypothetical protein LV471_05045 [Nitrosomonas sp.]|nr:hypothetical protein [Nitrosomonas sp.]
MLGMFDIIIAMIFIYAFFASLVSGVNELIVQVLAMRGRVLFEGIAMMLGELPRDTGSWIVREFKIAKRKLGFADTHHAQRTNALFAHPLIDTLSPPGSSRPSYISPKTFSMALIYVLSIDGSVENLRKSLEDRSKPLNKLLGPMLDEAKDNLDAFKMKVEEHYNAVMDRASGWYKRRTQFMMFFVGLILAGCLNVDSIYIVQQLQKNPEQVQKLVAAAAEYSPASEQGESAADEQEKLIQTIRELNIKTDEFRNMGLPIGWSIARETAYMQPEAEHISGAFAHGESDITFSLLPGQKSMMLVFIGWLATALAGALGAPFWFDAISKAFAVRGSGRKPGESN